MSDSESGINIFLDTTAEPALKPGAAGLGALYVFGLLVSNVHLMAVGVSSPFVENDRTSEPLLAIDIGMVRVIQYIPASARIPGRRIVKIYKE